MSAIPITSRQMTLEEYSTRQPKRALRYFDGAIFRLSGVSANHADIESNLILILKNEARAAAKISAESGFKSSGAAFYRFIGDLR